MEEDSEQVVWPPDDPTRPYFEEAEGEFKLPDSPWTFENGGVNPDLQPSNTQLRQSSLTRRPFSMSLLPNWRNIDLAVTIAI